jgi:phospholipase/carboxylesterase
MMPGIDSRAWWHIDMLAMQNAIERGQLRDLSAEPDGLTEAREKMVALLEELAVTHAPTKLVLGGFSQGSMLALDVALRTTLPKCDALVVLSGTLLAEDVWVPRMQALAGRPIFQSHGSSDPILPFALAERLRQELSSAGAQVTFVPFRGAHEIPSSVLDRLSVFLSDVLA